MRRPEDVRERLAAAWQRRWPEWLGGAGDWPLTVPLDVPTQAQAQARWQEFTRWIEAWATPPATARLERASRSWGTLGQQTVPTHVAFDSPAALAAFVSPSAAAEFARADARFVDRRSAWPELDASLRRAAGWLAGLSEADYERAVRAVDWLAANPDTRLYPRQLPIEGLDTKWLEANAAPVAHLLAQRLHRAPAPFEIVAGLAVDPPRRRVRLLDPALRERFGGLSDLSLRADELAAVDLGARVALIVENQQCALACEDLPGAIVIMGGGFSATSLCEIPWLQNIPVIYWGDLDVSGFRILDGLRKHVPHAQSCLMDLSTLQSYRHLWTTDPNAHRAATVDRLTPAETEVHEGLLRSRWGHGVRLEQERLPWASSWQTLRRAGS